MSLHLVVFSFFSPVVWFFYPLWLISFILFLSSFHHLGSAPHTALCLWANGASFNSCDSCVSLCLVYCLGWYSAGIVLADIVAQNAGRCTSFTPVVSSALKWTNLSRLSWWTDFSKLWRWIITVKMKAVILSTQLLTHSWDKSNKTCLEPSQSFMSSTKYKKNYKLYLPLSSYMDCTQSVKSSCLIPRRCKLCPISEAAVLKVLNSSKIVDPFQNRL